LETGVLVLTITSIIAATVTRHVNELIGSKNKTPVSNFAFRSNDPSFLVGPFLTPGAISPGIHWGKQI